MFSEILTSNAFVFQILLLTILTSSIRKPQAVQKIFEEKRGPVSIDARTVSSQKARFSCKF